MSWQQILTLAIVLTVAVIFVWRSSNPGKSGGSCGCGCPHDHDEDHDHAYHKEKPPR